MTRLPAALAAATLLAAACGGTGTGSQPSPGTSPMPTPAVATAAPTPAPGTGCRLPVASGDAPITGVAGQGNTGHGGFLNHPSGTFTADTSSQGAYSAALSRWLPVRRQQVSPDGRAYAWVELPQQPGAQSSTLHVVDSGGDHRTALSAAYGVIGWDGATSVLLDRIVPFSDAPPTGLFAFSVASAQLKQLSSDQRGWSTAAHGFVYATAVDSADPHPPVQQGPGGPPGNEVISYELATGKTAVVAKAFGTSVGVLGVDPAGGVAYSSTASNSYTVYLSGTTPKTLYSGPRPSYQGADPSPIDVMVDSRGTWLAAYNGDISIYDGTGTRKVGSVPFQFPVMAGPCA